MIMGVSDKLQRIPLCMYDDLSYTDNKEMYFEDFNSFLKDGYSVKQSVVATWYYLYDGFMDENGMDKFVALISGMLFMIDHGEVDPDVSYGTSYDIGDFETGDYDDLFTNEDLKQLKKDIQFIRDYLNKHPDLVKE